MRRFIPWLPLAVVAVAVLAAGGFFLYARWDKALLQRPVGPPSLSVDLEVQPGMTAAQIERALIDAGIVRRTGAFRRAAQARGADRSLLAGRYHITGNMSLLDIVDALTAGRTVFNTLRIPEGATMADIARLCEASGVAKAEDVKRAALAGRVRLLDATLEGLDGFLYPATYPLHPAASATDVVTRLHQRFQEACVELGFRLDGGTVALPGDRRMTPLELVTLASIVEGEAASPGDRPLIAGVFLNRLARKMRLQSCATVYAALGARPVPLLKQHLEVDSPFNTYKVTGLPPRPICCPGKAALAATLEPAQHEYLYFVAKGDGTHVFSATLKDHNRAKQQYKKYLRVDPEIDS